MIDEVLLDKVKDELFKKCEELYSKERNTLEDEYYKLCCKIHEGINEILSLQFDLYPAAEIDEVLGELADEKFISADIPDLNKDMILKWHKEANRKRVVLGKEPYDLPTDAELEHLLELTKGE